MVDVAVNPSIQETRDRVQPMLATGNAYRRGVESLVSPRVISSKTPDHQGYYNRCSGGNATLQYAQMEITRTPSPNLKERLGVGTQWTREDDRTRSESEAGNRFPDDNLNNKELEQIQYAGHGLG